MPLEELRQFATTVGISSINLDEQALRRKLKLNGIVH